jgi:serine/threonine protein kinase/TPR repeat protein
VAQNKTEPLGRFEHYRVMTDAEGRPIKLGEGAMGVTYLAEDTNLRVKVALKVIAPSLLGDTEIVQRFQREAQAAARLRHPNVAAVYHLGTVDDTFFYTMEFVEGRTLREHIAENGPLTILQALDITLQMAEALGAAEKHQMVHRDIKPANIMLEKTDDGLHAKLIDFGLAKPLQHDAQQTSALLTQRGTFLGTAVFASPEQVQDLPLDTRSDFYALGLTMWVMLEGRPPFEGSLHKVLYDQVHTKPPLDRLLWVPAEVRELLSKLLEKQPEDRPQTARELRQTIQDCKRAAANTSSTQADWQRRFQVRHAARAQPWGMIYEGEDSRSGAVCLHFLRSDRFGNVDTLNAVIAGVRKAIEIHHPNVLRHFTVFPANDPNGATGWMVVTEHPGAHTLLGHLQQVKQLSAAEAFPLIERLAEALDCCLASDLHSVELDAARIYLKPQSAADGTGPVEVVPKLLPVDYRFSTSLGADDDAALGLTQIAPRGEARNAADAVHRLATLAYQCLGGSWGRMTRYIPLPGLTQHQNETLRETLTTKKYTRGADLIDALRQTKTARRNPAAPRTVAEATVTLSPWERLAALASPPAKADEETTISPKPTRTAATPAAESRAATPPPAFEAPAPDVEPAPEKANESAFVAEVSQPPEPQVSSEPEAAPEPEPSAPAVEAPAPDEDELVAPQEEPVFSPSEEIAAHEAAVVPVISSAGDIAAFTSDAPTASATATASVRTSATELPLPGQASRSTKSTAKSVLRQTVEREWRDAKPLLNKVTTPVRDTVGRLPRWIFVTGGIFIAVVGVGLWMIANRSVTMIPKPDADPGKGDLVAITTPDLNKAKTTTTTKVTPPPPSQPSLDQLLESGTAAASRGNSAELLPIWQDMQKRFPDRKWSSLTKSTAFVTAVTQAWRENKLGDPTKAAHDYLPIIDAAAKSNDVAILKKLSVDLKDDAPAAQPYELALLNTLVEDKGKSEELLDESLRLVQTRKTGASADRARDLIRQSLEPLVRYREQWKRPDDMEAGLRNGMKALTPKFEALAATNEPSALYLYADKLHTDGRIAESITYFEKAAQLDHAPSMLQLGLLLSNAKDKAASLPKAVYWFNRADALGYPQATFLLGECYLDGKGVGRDYDLALTKLEAAASKDIAEAHEMLAETYKLTSIDVPPGDDFNPEKLNPTLKGDARVMKAREHFEKALKYGFAKAAGPLGGMVIQGQGGPRDVGRGVALLDQACKLDNPDPAILRNYAYILMPKLMQGVPVTREELNAAKVKADANRSEQLMRQAAKALDPIAQRWCRDNNVRY